MHTFEACKGPAHYRAYSLFGVFLSSSLAVTFFLGGDIRQARAQYPEMAVCKDLTDRWIGEGRVAENDRQTSMEYCLTGYQLCAIKLFGLMANEDDPSNKSAIERCLADGARFGEKVQDAARHRHSDENKDELAKCIGGVADAPSAASGHCTAVINADGASQHARAMAYAYRALAEVFQDNKDQNGQGMADSANAIQLDPNVGEAYFVRGTLHMNKLMAKEAVADFDRALSLNVPTIVRANAYYGRGVERELLGAINNNSVFYRQALTDYENAIRILPRKDFYSARASLQQKLARSSTNQTN